jgi:hypothetical protein
VAFHQHPSAVAMHPAMRHPNRMRMRRRSPDSATPHIAVPIPVIVTRLPNPSCVRGRTIVLTMRRRRAHANIYLGIGSRRKQSRRKQSCSDCNLLHSRKLLLLIFLPEPVLSGPFVKLNRTSAQKLRSCGSFSTPSRRNSNITFSLERQPESLPSAPRRRLCTQRGSRRNASPAESHPRLQRWQEFHAPSIARLRPSR